MTALPDPMLSAPCRLERHDTCPEPRRCECGCHIRTAPSTVKGGRLVKRRRWGKWT